jgi:hypothetical protein
MEQSQALGRILPDSFWLCSGIRERVGRTPYAIAGFALMAIKYLAEAGVLYQFAGELLTPWEFVNPLMGERTRLIQAGPDWLGWALFVWTLPFVWVAFSMSVRRAADAGVSPWLGLSIFVPLLNVAVMLLLATLPTREDAVWGSEKSPSDYNYYAAPQATEPSVRQEQFVDPHALALRARRRQAVLAIGVSVAVGAGMVFLGIYALGDYGAALFFGTPLVMGACCGFLYNRPYSQSTMSTTGIVALMLLIAMGALIGFALEGAICVIMAVPILLPLCLFGGWIGKAIADSSNASYRGFLPLVLLLPAVAAVESSRGKPQTFMVMTSLEIDAPAETVWNHVIEFPELDPPDEWYFKLGIAAPLRARIERHGVGATRHCEFTTGAFVEPITVWEAPHRLAFNVADQPPPMIELSPYRHVHPTHLENQTLRSLRGEFRLIPLSERRTRLEGRTWYEFQMFPQSYWTLWSDTIIQRIHLRVLAHIKGLADTH